MNKSLLKEALIKYVSGVVLVGLLLFLPAWTFNWPNAWLFMSLLFLPMLVAGIVMYFKAPNLLRSRLKAKENISQQKTVINLSGLMFIAAFVLAGLNYRFKWTSVPVLVVNIAAAVFLLSYLMFAEVLRENAYLSRVIEVTDNQQVIDTGLYGFIRHPMYTATIFLFLSMPLILGCWPSFVIMLSYIFIIGKRALNEEKYLEENLEGYKEYENKVKYRLIPFVW